MKVELRHLGKSFGALRANDDICLTIAPGTMHALLGENGAGKSTLMKILAGFQPADSGEILLDGEAVTLTTPAVAVARGIGMLYQEPVDFPNLTVLDNFLLGRPGGVRLAAGAARAELLRLARQFAFTFDPAARVSTLGLGERQQLELVRLLALGVKVLILDESTTAISAQQRDKLFAALRRLVAGGMSIIFVTHKLAEAQELCGRATVLARGRVTGERELPCANDELVRLMFGTTFSAASRADSDVGRPLLELTGLGVVERQLELRDFTLTVHAGEIIGLAGLEGNGQHLLLRACAGLLPCASGQLQLAGRSLAGRAYGNFLDAGVCYIPADRLGEGLIAKFTVAAHHALSERRHPFAVDWPAARTAAAARIRDFKVKGAPGSQISELSGGNQQRVMLGLLPDDTNLLLLEHPTRGLDLESGIYIWNRLRERVRHGAGIIFASADLEELLEMSDRIIVFFAGRTRIVDARTATTATLGALIGGEGFHPA